jgi:hypothetical protein
MGGSAGCCALSLSSGGAFDQPGEPAVDRRTAIVAERVQGVSPEKPRICRSVSTRDRYGRAMNRSVQEWRQLATEAVTEFIDAERAFVMPELEAKLADQGWGDYPAINPHHLTTARKTLESRGVISALHEQTRGGARITAYAATSRSKESARRAARKRLLNARFHGWTRASSDWNPAPIPAALERVVHASLTNAAPHGYRLLEPSGRHEVRTVFNQRVPGGPLDNAAFYTGISADGVPGRATLVPIEAKNIRAWVYPRTQELYQLLDKSCSLHDRRPDVAIAPVFVCRRIHPTTAWMARQMGFHVIETRTQYVRPVVLEKDDVARRKYDEVVEELGFKLTPHEGSVPPMVQQFSTILPERIDDAAERWGLVSDHPRVPDLLALLRDDEIPLADRYACLVELGQSVEEATGEPTRWVASDHAEADDSAF